jgi:hypothetical protein
MSTGELDKARLAEYQQRQLVDLLRQQLYTLADPGRFEELSQSLVEAESTLREREMARQVLEQARNLGVLLDSDRQDRDSGGVIMGADTTGIEAKVLLRMSHVPTGIVHLFDPEEHPLVTFRVRKAQPPGYVRLRLKSFVEEYSATAVDTVEMEYSEEPEEIHQLPTFFPERVRAVNELTRATLHIVIDDLDGGTEQESTFPLWLLARTSAYNARIEDPSKGQWVDLSHFYGAWVTPNAPEILELLRRVADLHPERAITGYLSRSREVATRTHEVEAQVRAVYNALKAEQILYIRSGLTLGAGEGESMQRARLPREVLGTKSANCLDGTLLMASVLEAVSLHPGLTLVPGHAFLAWEKQPADKWEGPDEDRWDYVETTMLSTDSFEAAQAEGRRQAKYWLGKKETGGQPWLFRRLAVAELRSQRGIVPME